MILFGAGGHGKVIMSILDDQGITITAIFDENPKIKEFCGLPVRQFSIDRHVEDEIIIAIGNNRIRFQKTIQLSEYQFGKVIHSSAYVDKHAQVENGTVVMPMAVINAGTRVGTHCIINSGSVVEHDCVLSGCVHVAPHATICGGCEIGEGSLIGAGAVLVPGIKIGRWCTIGAGAVLTQDIPDEVIVVGNPAKNASRNE